MEVNGVASEVALGPTPVRVFDDEAGVSGQGKVARLARDDLETTLLLRRRVAKEYAWQSSAWVKTNEVRYVYDGNLVLQERDANNLPKVTYTRGDDLSHSPQGAGGIVRCASSLGSLAGHRPVGGRRLF